MVYSLNRRFTPLVLAAVAVTLTACVDLLDPGEPGNLVPRTVVEDASLPRIRVAGTLLHSEAFGNPAHPMVMVLHGGPGADYRSVLPLQALAGEGYYVVFWDQRGAGLSQRHDAGIYTLALYLQDLRLVLEHYTRVPGQPVVFIGHSWGAMYATWFINEHGDYGGRIRGAILSDPGAFTKRQLDAYATRLWGSLDLFGEQINDAMWLERIMSPRDHARFDFMRMVQGAGGMPAEHLDRTNPSPQWRFGAVVQDKLTKLVEKHGFDWTTNLGAYTRPVLFLRGELNEAMPLWHQQELASSYPDAAIITIPGVGHEMIWERPTEYLAHTRTYFQRIGFSGGGS
jgi:proline iminopeptidase